MISRRSKWVGKGSRPGCGPRGFLALGRLVFSAAGRDARLREEPAGLRGGELFAFGPPELESKQADFLVLEVDDLVLEQDGVGLADFGRQMFGRAHLLYIYIIYTGP